MTTCKATSQTHRDAEAIVWFLVESGGYSTLTNEAISLEIGFTLDNAWDKGRWYRAKAHLADRTAADGQPCCGYRLHYRTTHGRPALHLVDPTAAVLNLAEALMEILRGWHTREQQHRVEQRRVIQTFDAARKHAIQTSDWVADELMVRAANEIRKDGVVHSDTLVDFASWMEGASS